jgi:23S rRNA pseudouridine2605 synthase
MLDDGRTGPAVVKKVGKATENSWLEVTIFEGRKHQVKRMLDAVHHPVLKLKRVKFGPLTLGDLPTGHYRYLTDREANAVRELARERQDEQAGGGQARAKQARVKRARAKWARNARSSRQRNVSPKQVST